MNNIKKTVTGLLSLFVALSATATPVEQYATTVIDFSSQWSSGSWSANQVLGAPNTFSYGDIASAWAPQLSNNGNQDITVGFDTAVYSTGAVIRETYGNGFVFQVDALDINGILHTVWNGTDTSLAGSPVDFEINWNMTNFLVSGLMIYTDTDHNMNAWEEIDSILLRGDTQFTAAVPEPGSIFLVGLGLVGLCFARRRIA